MTSSTTSSPALSFAFAACVSRSWSQICSRIFSCPKFASALSLHPSLEVAWEEVTEKVLAEPIRPHFIIANVGSGFRLFDIRKLVRRSKQSSVVVSVRSEDLDKPKSESGGGGFTKTKLKALKIYGELKKVKQPILPGGKIASFINSIFNSGNVKKAKMCYVGAVEDVSTSEHVSKSNYSSCSASTFSRSCLSKPSKKSSNGNKREGKTNNSKFLVAASSSSSQSWESLSHISSLSSSSSLVLSHSRRL